MPRCGQTRKRDASENAIVEALRAVGAHVVRISGKDAPDLLVRYRGHWTPIECKSGKGKATEGQEAADYPIARTADEALKAIGIQ